MDDVPETFRMLTNVLEPAHCARLQIPSSTLYRRTLSMSTPTPCFSSPITAPHTLETNAERVKEVWERYRLSMPHLEALCSGPNSELTAVHSRPLARRPDAGCHLRACRCQGVGGTCESGAANVGL